MLMKKKGKSGAAARFMTRNMALKRLQLRLSEFRRLCILKAVHPREPKRKPHGAGKTYYAAKDIAFLQHEPLLEKMRELHAYEKKVRRARAKKNAAAAERLARRRPRYQLDHLVRERYPSFVDAVRDLDDPLAMMHLFAVLPAEGGAGIPARVVRVARQLALEWQAWVVRAGALRKAFISVKGYYFQAEVHGERVTWLVPHALSQVLPPDVDYRVMLTFLEFYQTLLQFVNFKLYHGLGLRYPPVLDPATESEAVELEAVMRDLASAAGRELVDARHQDDMETEEQDRRDAEADADVQRRLQERVRELEREIKATGGVHDGDDDEEEDAASGGDDASEDEQFEIDSGDEEQEEGSVSDSEEEDGDVSDPESADLELESDGEEAQDAAAAAASADSDAEEAGSDEDEVPGTLGVDPNDDAAVSASIFKGLVFFLGREVPRELLLFVIRACGGLAAWDGPGSPLEEGDERITHQVVDRPRQGHRFLSRVYVQPQWVFDSLNAGVLAPAEPYAPGHVPPPHLSPFVDDDEEGYVPEYGRELRALRQAAAAAYQASLGRIGFLGDGIASAMADGDDAAQADVTEEQRASAAAAQHAAELEKELGAAGAAPRTPAPGAPAPGLPAEDEQEMEEAMASTMMTRKNRKLYASLQRSANAKKARVDALQRRAKEAKQ